MEYQWPITIPMPDDYVADGELLLSNAAAQRHERILYHILLALEKSKIQNLKHGFC